MKKFVVAIFSFMLMLTCGVLLSPTTLTFADDAVDNNVQEVKGVNADNIGSDYTSWLNDNDIVLILEEDIDFDKFANSSSTNSSLWDGFGNDKYFSGTFDGNGHTISNIDFASNNGFFGLFPYAKNATIKNLKISGECSFNFSEAPNEIYAGLIVGYGENVIIENCQVDCTIIQKAESIQSLAENEGESGGTQTTPKVTSNEDIEPLAETEPEQALKNSNSQNFNFGALAGKLSGNSRKVSSDCPYESNVTNCLVGATININYVDFNENNIVNVGGLVGVLEGSYVSHSIVAGNVSFTRTTSTTEANSIKKVGGIVALASTSSAKIKNSCFTGKVTAPYTSAGNIVGALSTLSSPSTSNFTYDYFVDANLNGIGGTSYTSNNFKFVSAINKDFLCNTSNFDPASEKWNFETIWLSTSGIINLQNFQKFSFSLSTLRLDKDGIIDKNSSSIEIIAEIPVVREAEGITKYKINDVKYNSKIQINLVFKPDYFTYYTLDSIMLEGNIVTSRTLSNLADGKETTQGVYTISRNDDTNTSNTCYTISFVANDTTKGEYSFATNMTTYSAKVEIEANEDGTYASDRGGVKVAQASSISPNINIEFSYIKRDETVVAEGKDKYIFSEWKLYEEIDNGWKEVDIDEDDKDVFGVPTIKITYGDDYYKGNFKLVATFTESVTTINLGSFNSKQIRAITIDGQEYTNDGIAVPAEKSRVVMQVTTYNAILNVKEFALVDTNNQTAGDYNSAITPIGSEPIAQDGIRTYTFIINMNLINNQMKKEALTLTLASTEDEEANHNGMLWVYIVVPVVLVGAIVGIVIFVIKRRGGGKGKKGKTKKEPKETRKEASYKDYYV